MGRLSELRAKAGMTQAELASMVGVTPRSVKSWEATSPPKGKSKDIAAALGCGVNDLTGRNTKKSGSVSVRKVEEISNTLGPEPHKCDDGVMRYVQVLCYYRTHEAKMTIAELSAASGVPVKRISEMENGLRPVDGEDCIRLAGAIGVKPEYLKCYWRMPENEGLDDELCRLGVDRDYLKNQGVSIPGDVLPPCPWCLLPHYGEPCQPENLLVPENFTF